MAVFNDVKKYIKESIFHNDDFNKLSEEKQVIAVNNAEELLYSLYKRYNPESNPLPVKAIAYQTVWIVAKDSGIRKSELGLASQSMEGMTQTFKGGDKTVAPEVKKLLKKRVGRYTIHVADTDRWRYFR